MTRVLALLACLVGTSVQAQAPSDWIRLGEAVHGGFGTLIPLGIRIGLDARERLKAGPRELDVTYLDGARTPCACVVDGILIATTASPGQGSLRVLPEKAAAGLAGEVLVRHRKTGAQLRYRIPEASYAEVLKWNADTTPDERFRRVMAAPVPFLVEQVN